MSGIRTSMNATTSPPLGLDLFTRPRSSRQAPTAKPAPASAVNTEESADLDFQGMQDLLGVSPPTLTRILACRGKLGLPARKVGGKWAAPRSHFAAWLDKISLEGWIIECGEGGVRAVKADGTVVL